ncbi:MAG TPA: hypothetical protein VK892_13560 [Pyrinomonadaceae bacterium]|nr:hypothetical protein [Pyrinomonadaceae bacterium]
MNTETDKLNRIGEILQDENFRESFEAVSLALSIQDEEDRDWQLLNIIHWLLKGGDWQKAFGIAQLMSENYEKSESLREIANYLASIGHLEKAFYVFAEAEKASISENLSAWQKAELLHKIAKSLWKVKSYYRADEVWQKAIEIARDGEESESLQNSLDSSSVLAEIAENFASEDRIERAFSLAQNIKNIGKRERALNSISEHSQQVKKVA